jgi:uncharacterized membrane protein
MSAPLSPPPRPRRSWLLIVSLCLNIALVPVIAAVVVRAMHRDTAIGSGGVLAPRSLMTALPAQSGAIQKVIDAHTAKIRGLREASLRARRQAFALLASPGYTPEKMSAALQAITAADTALETESIAMMGDSIARLTPAERQAIADKVRKRNNSWLFRMFRPRAR